jgi:hypothetical protein
MKKKWSCRKFDPRLMVGDIVSAAAAETKKKVEVEVEVIYVRVKRK